ncbi:O-antigen/teichoic acid export membrane protein [Oxalobacteraceae bacterium GrIS 1.11]
MSLSRKFIYTIFIQSLGTGCSLLTVFFLARWYGPGVQGQFAQTKAWVDLLVVIGCFGFPQGFVYVINKFKCPPRTLIIWSCVYACVFAAAATLLTAAAIEQVDYVASNLFQRFSMALVFGLSAAALVLISLWRGIYLPHNDGWRFSGLTIVPAVALFLAMMLVLALKPSIEPALWAKAYALSAALACLVAAWLIFPLYRNDRSPAIAIPWRSLLTSGTSVFVQGLTMAIQPVLTFWLMRRYGASNAQIGWFNIAVMGYQAFGLPLAMVTPILFNRWSKANSVPHIRAEYLRLLRTSMRFLFPFIALAVLAAQLLPFILNREYEKAVFPAQILLFAVYPLFLARTAAPLLFSQDAFARSTHAYLLRLLVSAALLFIFLVFGMAPQMAAALAWLLAELFCAIYIIVGLMKLLDIGLAQALLGKAGK